MMKCHLKTMFSLWIILFGTPFLSHALVRDMPEGTTIKNDFALAPAKVELNILPGKSQTKYLYVTNRFDRPALFTVSVEDFSGSRNITDGAALTGFSRAQHYFKISDSSFVLASGEREKIAINVTIPSVSAPEEIFASVIVAGTPEGSGVGATKIVSRAGALFFIRTSAHPIENGMLRDFRSRGASLELEFENTGNVHLNPYGGIEIRNMFGTIKKIIPVDPWFVMPGFFRVRSFVIDDIKLWGKYTAIARMNRGYQNQIDERTVEFWILPNKYALGGTTGLIAGIIIFIIRKRRRYIV